MTCKLCENGHVAVHPPQHVAYMRGELSEATMRKRGWMRQDGKLKPMQPTYAACTCEEGDRLTQRPKLKAGKIDGVTSWLPRVFSTRLLVPMTEAGIESDLQERRDDQWNEDFGDWGQTS